MNANGKRISELVIGCAITVSNELGSGFLEALYSNALGIEFAHAGLLFERERQLRVRYKHADVGVYYADFLVEGCLLVELKALRALAAEHEAQVMNYLRASGITAALLLNFGTAKLGIERVVLRHNDSNFI